MADIAVEVRSITKIIKGHVILDDVSCVFERGKIHGLVGRNGSGKSMLLKIICGLTPASGGEVIVGGKVLGKDFDFPPEMSCIIESPGFLAGESGLNNLLYLKGLIGKPDKKALIQLLDMVGLKEHTHKKAGKYSTGMKQRLGLAQVLMDDSRLIILDEPLSGLDKSGIDLFRETFLSLKNQGKTILLSTHVPEDLEVLCDNVYQITEGRLSLFA